jgi:hypothetical protein
VTERCDNPAPMRMLTRTSTPFQLRRVIGGGVILVLCSHSATAAPNDKQAALREARATLWIGTAMVAAGALLMPLTGVDDGSQTPERTIGLALMSGGALTLWFGAKQRRKALAPETRIGVALGDRRSAHVVIRW